MSLEAILNLKPDDEIRWDDVLGAIRELHERVLELESKSSLCNEVFDHGLKTANQYPIMWD